MWFKNKRKIEELKRKIEELENSITQTTNFNRLMIKIGAFDGCVGKYVRTVDSSSSFSFGAAVARIGFPSQVYRIIVINESGTLTLKDYNGMTLHFSADDILRLASDDEINDFKQQELKKSKRQINKGQIRGDIIGNGNR